MPLATLRKLIDYFPTPQDVHPLNPSYEFTEVAAIPENVAKMKDLQKFVNVGWCCLLTKHTCISQQ